MLQIQCPHCKNAQSYEVSSESRTVVCSECQQSFTIPGMANSKGNFGDQVLKHGKKVAQDLHSISFREEILPLDQANFTRFSRSFTFWGITLLGMIPLLIVTVDRSEAQLTLFALFFALVWGLSLKSLSYRMRDPGPGQSGRYSSPVSLGSGSYFSCTITSSPIFT